MYKLNMLLVFILAGCTTVSAIQPVETGVSRFDTALIYKGKESIVGINENNAQEYRIFHQGATGATPSSAIRSSAERRANEFCNKENKQMKAIRERTSVPPHMFGNWPRIEIIFICVEKSIDNDNFDDGKYKKLINLKQLLDQGVLSQQEFNKEKSKILGH